MTLLLCVITDIMHVVSILLMSNMLFKFDRRKTLLDNFKWLLVGVYIVGLSIAIYLWDDFLVETIIYMIAISVLLYYLYQEKWLTVIVTTVWMTVIMSMLDTMFMVLVEILTKMVGYSNLYSSKCLGSTILCLVVFLLGRIFAKKYNKGIRTIGVLGIIFFTVLTIVDTFIVMVLARITISEAEREVRDVLFTVFILVILGLFLQLGAVILILMQRNIYKESQQLNAKYLEEQKRHYKYLENRETETKKFRHDLRSHIDLLAALAREHRYDEFDDYVKEINMKVDKFKNEVTVQNGIVDAIINKYYADAKDSGVRMEVNGRFPTDCKIHGSDLCTIFANLLSNAMEAAVEAEDKWISVDCRYTDKVIVVVIKNSFDNKKQLGNGKGRTHKADKNNHGFGLINVEESIERYNGVWYIDQEDDVYKVTISFVYARMEDENENSDN